jgi:hypothetical protein
MINNAKEHNNAQKNILKEEMLHVITENFIVLLLDTIKQNL